MRRKILAIITGSILVAPTVAWAQIKIGVTVTATGPASSLGIPGRNAISLAPKTIAGKTVEYIVLDDATDPTGARRNIERFVTDDKVDLVIGSSSSPVSLAMIEVAGRSQTPMISLGAARAIISPMDSNRRWVFKTPYNDATTAAATVKHMKASGVKTVATISVNDAYGQGWVKEFRGPAEAAGLQIVASEQYEAKDTSATAQVLKVMAARPDAILITSFGTPGTLPQIALAERNYGGKIYQTTGIVNNDVLRVGGKAMNGTLIAGNPLSIADQLPANNPAKSSAMEFTALYDKAFGAGTTNAFAGYAWDAILLAQAAIPEALKKAEPGTPAFRSALRDALEALKGVATTQGPVTMSPEDHSGYSADAPVMITVRGGKFTKAD